MGRFSEGNPFLCLLLKDSQWEFKMCLAVPGKVIELSGVKAKVELSGNVLDADLSLIDDPGVGDWVLLHAGFAIEKLDPAEAEETLRLFSEMEEGLGGPAKS